MDLAGRTEVEQQSAPLPTAVLGCCLWCCFPFLIVPINQLFSPAANTTAHRSSAGPLLLRRTSHLQPLAYPWCIPSSQAGFVVCRIRWKREQFGSRSSSICVFLSPPTEIMVISVGPANIFVVYITFLAHFHWGEGFPP